MDPLLAGTVLKNQWELGRVLGSGSFSMVMIAQETSTGKEYAAKIERRGKTADGTPVPPTELHLWKEIAALRNVKIRSICGLIDHGITDDFGFLILTKGGPSLKQLVRQGYKFTLLHCLRLLSQMTKALCHVHKLGFVHQDVNTGNVLWWSEEDPNNFMLVDLGESRPFGDQRINADGGTSFEVRPSRGKVGDQGAPMYRSVNADRGHDLCPKDDHLSLINVCEDVYGVLPWKLARSFEDLEATKRKSYVDGDLLPSYPNACQEYALYVKSLGYGDMVDPAFVKTKLEEAANQANFKPEDVTDFEATGYESDTTCSTQDSEDDGTEKSDSSSDDKATSRKRNRDSESNGTERKKAK